MALNNLGQPIAGSGQQASGPVNWAAVTGVPYQAPTPVPQVNPTGTTSAPAVYTASNAQTQLGNVQNAVDVKTAGAATQAQTNAAAAALKNQQNQQQQAQTNASQSAATANQAQQTQLQNEIQSTQDLLTAAQGAGYTGTDVIQYDANGNIIPKNQIVTPATSTTTPVVVPPGVDTSNQAGQIAWYNQDPASFEQWAQTQGMSETQIDSLAYAASVQTLQNLQQQGTDIMNQYLSGTFPLTADQQAQVAALQAQWDSTIAAQQNANDTYVAAAGMAGMRAGGEYDPTGMAADVQRAMSTGLNDVKNFQAQETSAIAALKQSFQDKDYQAAITNYNNTVTLDSKISDTLKSVYDIAYQTQTDLDTKTYNEVTKPIQDIQLAAAQAGAPTSVTDKINSAKSVDDAIAAAGDWLQTSTNPTVSLYLEYKKEAEAAGQTPMSMLDFQNAQDNLTTQKAANQAAATEAAKNQVDINMGLLTPEQQKVFDTINNDKAWSQEQTQFQTTTDNYQKIQDIKTNDPASQGAALAAFVQMAVPGSKSLRGSSGVLTQMFGNTLASTLINIQKTFTDTGTLNSQDIASLKAAANTLYQSESTNFNNSRNAVITQLANNGIQNGDKLLIQEAPPQTVAQQQAAQTTAVNNFVSASQKNTDIKNAFIKQFPNSTPQDFYNYLQSQGFITQ